MQLSFLGFFFPVWLMTLCVWHLCDSLFSWNQRINVCIDLHTSTSNYNDIHWALNVLNLGGGGGRAVYNIIIIGNLWRPISWEPRVLTKQIACHTHTQPHKHPTHPHTHTHTPQKHKHSSHGFDGNRRKKARNQKAEEKRWVFSFDLKEESDMACLTEKEKEFQMTGPIYWKDLSPRVLLHTLGTRKIRVSEAEWREREGE